MLDEQGSMLENMTPETLNPLGSHKQVAAFLHQILPSRLNFRGSMVLVSQGDKKFSVVALVQNQGLFTAIPVIAQKTPTVPGF